MTQLAVPSTDSGRIIGNRFTPLTTSPLSALRREVGTPLIVCWGSLDVAAVDLVEQALASIGHTASITLLISSRGGHVMPAFKIALLLRQFSEHVTIVVPRRARSSATLLVLGADTVTLGQCAELGPLDASVCLRPLSEDDAVRLSVTDVPYLHLVADKWFEAAPERVLTRFSDNALGIMTLISLYKTERVVSQLGTHLLGCARCPLPQDTIVALIDRLMHGYVSHDYPIMRTEAAVMGLPVDTPTADYERLLLDAQTQCDALVTRLGSVVCEARTIILAGLADNSWYVWPNTPSLIEW